MFLMAICLYIYLDFNPFKNADKIFNLLDSIIRFIVINITVKLASFIFKKQNENSKNKLASYSEELKTFAC